MTRRLRLLASMATCWSLVIAAACSGDDIEYAPQDGGARDASAHASDGTAGDTAVDAGIDSGCGGYDASALDPTKVAAGKALVTSHMCQQCHGGNLSGNNDGVMAPGGRQAYPPNLTGDPMTGLGCWTDDQIVNAILHGIDNEGMPLCPPMPVFADAGVDTPSAQAIVEYLRSLQVVVNQVPNTECSGDAGVDAAPKDAGLDGAADGGGDAASDSGADAAVDAAVDAGSDAGDATIDAGDASDDGAPDDAG